MNNKMYTSGDYLAQNPSWHVEDSPWKARQILKMLQKNELNPKSICEVGCGAGEILSQLHSQLPEEIVFSGYEISPHAFELCQERRKERLHFYLQDLLQEQEDLYFDIVLCIDVFEHIEDYFEFLRCLKDKGQYKIFHIPLDLSVQTVLRCWPILQMRKSLGHVHYFTKELALSVLKDSGYQIVDCFYTATRIELSGDSLRGTLAKLPRKLMYKLNPDMTVRILGGYSLMVLTR